MQLTEGVGAEWTLWSCVLCKADLVALADKQCALTYGTIATKSIMFMMSFRKAILLGQAPNLTISSRENQTCCSSGAWEWSVRVLAA